MNLELNPETGAFVVKGVTAPEPEAVDVDIDAAENDEEQKKEADYTLDDFEDDEPADDEEQQPTDESSDEDSENNEQQLTFESNPSAYVINRAKDLGAVLDEDEIALIEKGDLQALGIEDDASASDFLTYRFAIAKIAEQNPELAAIAKSNIPLHQYAEQVALVAQWKVLAKQNPDQLLLRYYEDAIYRSGKGILYDEQPTQEDLEIITKQAQQALDKVSKNPELKNNAIQNALSEIEKSAGIDEVSKRISEYQKAQQVAAINKYKELTDSFHQKLASESGYLKRIANDVGLAMQTKKDAAAYLDYSKSQRAPVIHNGELVSEIQKRFQTDPEYREKMIMASYLIDSQKIKNIAQAARKDTAEKILNSQFAKNNGTAPNTNNKSKSLADVLKGGGTLKIK